MEIKHEENIEITNENIVDINYEDIIAVAYASGGAMGEPGAVNIYVLVDSRLQCYHGNHCYGAMRIGGLFSRFPEIKECVKRSTLNGFKRIDMGMGNMLMIRSEVYGSFIHILEEERVFIYSNYERIILQVCEEKEIKSIAQYKNERI